ncbi:hypothetical protein MST27_19360 [Pseudomonas sp. PS1]|uniref:Uncharacterized protein n=1 Tax=Stutzerimonas marianensis TaxID=2929513 RepID=A0A9X2AU37_9GAMM|nr:hypothetical protein [Pseudomonas marianensis]MCJ0975530.1 hypothetical protein [Pseudomonas marianensis]
MQEPDPRDDGTPSPVPPPEQKEPGDPVPIEEPGGDGSGPDESHKH